MTGWEDVCRWVVDHAPGRPGVDFSKSSFLQTDMKFAMKQGLIVRPAGFPKKVGTKKSCHGGPRKRTLWPNGCVWWYISGHEKSGHFCPDFFRKPHQTHARTLFHGEFHIRLSKRRLRKIGTRPPRAWSTTHRHTSSRPVINYFIYYY